MSFWFDRETTGNEKSKCHFAPQFVHAFSRRVGITPSFLWAKLLELRVFLAPCDKHSFILYAAPYEITRICNIARNICFLFALHVMPSIVCMYILNIFLSSILEIRIKSLAFCIISSNDTITNAPKKKNLTRTRTYLIVELLVKIIVESSPCDEKSVVS